MELTILLSKVLGLYMLIAGIAIFMNRKHIMLAVVAIAHERFAQLAAGIAALLLGLLIVNTHDDWSSFPAIIVSLIGWIILVKGLLYLFLPEAQLAKLIKGLKERSWYTIDGVVAIVLGLYLASFGFGWL